MNIGLGISIVSLISSGASIVFSYLAIRRSERQDNKSDGKTEGVMFSDIGYIKACVDRVEKNINKVDERDRSIAERLARVEETVSIVTRRVDEICKYDNQ